ncbi:MAG: 6,7-dimethyl-8-ribityllumazine synthase [Bacteroidetes bacterium]|nr:6,7-dimethyl-8-ribityllumazine synthase [Bacteroidota bacterium]
MASSLKNLSEYDPEQIPDGKGKRFGIVVSEWNKDITFTLHDGCYDTLLKHGVDKDDIIIKVVPGSFELPMGARQIALEEKPDAVICLGCVIKGETQHDVYINQAVASGIMQLSLTTGIPVIFGLLTPNTHEQAKDRAGGKHGNKGVEAAITALRMSSDKNDKKKVMGFGA